MDVRGHAFSVDDCQSLAPHYYGFYSRQVLWILSRKDVNELAYGTSVVVYLVPLTANHLPHTIAGFGNLSCVEVKEKAYGTSMFLIRCQRVVKAGNVATVLLKTPLHKKTLEDLETEVLGKV